MFYSIFRFIADESALKGIIGGLPTIALLAVIVGCILVLSKGADWMIHGVVQLSRRTGIPRIVIGATIISLGTTTPEAVISVMAAWMGDSSLALGNGVGSIIADTGLIFGLTCVLARVPVNKYILNRTGWVQIGSATLLVLMSVILLLSARGEPVLGRPVGSFFLVLLGLYMYVTYIWAKRGGDTALQGEALDDSEIMSLPKCWLLLLVGLFMVVVGARVLVPSTSVIAFRLGVPEDVIAATMVAFGTSVPELMTAIASVRKGHPEITVGNIVGADVLNCFFVIGAAAAARPLAVPENFYRFHFPVMLLILYSFRFFIFKDRDGFFKRSQGAWLLGVYLVYLVLQYGLNIGTAH